MATFTGTNSNDTLTGTNESDTFYPLLGTNSINAGGGDDAIYSVGGSDKINGGAGTDYWSGDYSSSATARTFTWNAATGAGTLTGGTTLTSIEYINFSGGTGNDTVTINGNVAGYGNYLNTGDGNDSITLRAGNVQVFGGVGTDSLTLDFSADVNGTDVSLSNNSAGGFGGSFRAFGSSYYSSGFHDVENVAVLCGSGDDYVTIDPTPLASGATVSANGGAGNDWLTIDFSALSNTSFVVGSTGAITSNRGSFANFENFYVTVGGGANTVTTGAGDDQITSNGGNDKINGGDGIEYWTGDYSASGTARTFAWNAATGAGTLTGGTTLTSIESVNFTGGTGNDTVTIDGDVAAYYGSITTGDGNDSITLRAGNVQVFGGVGTDSLTLDFSADVNGTSTSLSNSSAGGFGGSFSAFGSSYYYSGFHDVENVSVLCGSGDDYVTIDPTPLASGATVSANGGAGNDWLTIDFSALSNTSFVVGSTGAITSNRGSFANFENFYVTVGGGANTVTTGAGDDQITSNGGNDKINGGDGIEYWTGDYSASGTARTFAWNAATGAGTLTGGTTLTSIESVNFTSGTGNDTVTIDGYNAGYGVSINTGDGDDAITLRVGGVGANGGAGTDALTLDFTAETNAVSVSLSDNSDGGVYGSYSAFGYGGSFADFEKVIARGGSAGDWMSGAGGADTFFGNGGSDSLIGNAGNDSLDGGGGIDSMTGGLGNDTYVVGAVADISTELAGEGTDTIRSSITLSLSATERANIENLTLIGTAAINATGSAVNNTLTGNAAGNVLTGLGGVDRLIGSGGADTLDGGLGGDKFIYNAVGDSATGAADTIVAFDGLGAAAGDQIDLSKIDANTIIAADQAFSFIGTGAFTGTAGELHVVASGVDSLVQGDINGDAIADFEILVKNAAAANWAVGDFAL